VSEHEGDSGDVLIAFTRKGLSGGEVSIRDSLNELKDLTLAWLNSLSLCKDHERAFYV
jgi:hypothetical protein